MSEFPPGGARQSGMRCAVRSGVEHRPDAYVCPERKRHLLDGAADAWADPSMVPQTAEFGLWNGHETCRNNPGTRPANW